MCSPSATKIRDFCLAMAKPNSKFAPPLERLVAKEFVGLRKDIMYNRASRDREQGLPRELEPLT
jgi:hypothetical protein